MLEETFHTISALSHCYIFSLPIVCFQIHNGGSLAHTIAFAAGNSLKLQNCHQSLFFLLGQSVCFFVCVDPSGSLSEIALLCLSWEWSAYAPASGPWTNFIKRAASFLKISSCDRLFLSFSFYLSLSHSAALNASNYLSRSLSVPRPDPNRHFDLKSANTHSPVVLNAVVIRRGTRRLPKFRPTEFNLGDMFFVLIADRLWRSTRTQADLDAGP